VAGCGLSAALLAQAVDARAGNPCAFEVTGTLLREHGLTTLEKDLLDPLISNPRSGEMVKGHAIVLAELGLCRYEGLVVRDPYLFDGVHSKQARAEHILWRMALAQEVWALADAATVYRVVSSDQGIQPAKTSLLSTTFSRAVADSHLAGGAARRHVKLQMRDLPLDRLFMTFIETEAMNSRFREAEALLVGGTEGAL
jgi:hypothetical protein